MEEAVEELALRPPYPEYCWSRCGSRVGSSQESIAARQQGAHRLVERWAGCRIFERFGVSKDAWAR
jgi:hypothetical protein